MLRGCRRAGSSALLSEAGHGLTAQVSGHAASVHILAHLAWALGGLGRVTYHCTSVLTCDTGITVATAPPRRGIEKGLDKLVK